MKLGVKYGGVPSIQIKYWNKKTEKAYQHKMKVRDLTEESKPEPIVEYLMTRHKNYLAGIEKSDLVTLV